MVSLGIRWKKQSILSPLYSSTLIRSFHLSCPFSVAEGKEKAKKTVFLPSTTFSNHVKSTERSRMDQEINERGKLSSLYEWQLKERVDRKTVELMDGPPYANGPVHSGHAINKILKDFIIKSCISQGERVVFRPGWDCHGLPIELKITKNTQGKSPIEIREMGREVAQNAIDDQMNSFKRWGVSADWNDPYLTMSTDYVANQLRAFGRLIDKGLVYRDVKPVYWSPSSGTALAESELEYKEDHSSIAAYFRFKIIDVTLSSLSLSTPSHKSHIIYALTWTTTPWTLPLNNAISIDSNQEYSLIQMDDQSKNPIVELYIVASQLIDSLRSQLSPRSINVRGTLMGSDLNGKFYVGSWTNDVAFPIVSSPHVTMTMGTGCVHTAYAHGFDDYEVAKRRGDIVEVNVDERGRYTREMGYELEGKNVLGEGTKKVLELLKKDVVMTTKYVHSYPYDWRTKKPVIIRASAQWFIDTQSLSKKAEKAIEGITIGAGNTDLSKSLVAMVTKRPSWCISRQRVWGVPIPSVTVEGDEGSAITSVELVERVADLVEKKNDTDVWWKMSIDDIVDNKVRESLGRIGPLKKSFDVMDVWLDSGLAWTCARKKEEREEKRVADFVSEGVDQFRGWFQSMLLTCVALEDCAPFKRVFVHGFCMDDKGRKMSKSIGNVVDPDTVTDGSMSQNALGVDGLRLWVALYGSETSAESRIGPQVLKEVERKIGLVRNSIKFLLGAQSGMDVKWKPIEDDLPILDQYVLRRSIEFGSRMDSLKSSFRFRSMANETILFVQSISSNYLSLIRDRLYCDSLSFNSHRSAQYTMRMLGSILTHSISPILPHLSIEYEMHAVDGNPEEKLREIRTYGENKDENERNILNGIRLRDDLDQISTLLINLRSKIGETVGPKEDIGAKHIVLHLSHSDYNLLELIDERDVVEMLGISTIEKKREGEISSISIGISPSIRCDRCRKNRRDRGDDYCKRCNEALKN
ncbi:iars-2 [Pristionchus pacificus]|uniref:isoleucine--tRNA ligase n=1 Tax=Pristionchus pacificus TaxID=54126 RepID=A0A8R1V5Q3_PRIPA|nr:iars-2 [Pristionchus pacificus]